MRGADLIVRGRRVVTPAGVRAASVVVREGRIDSVLPFDAPLPDAEERLEAEDLLVAPGLVDTHVHANDPGRTEWEGLETATDAAAAGGVTTIVDMPLNSDPVTTTAAALGRKVAAMRGRCRVDAGAWGGLVPDNLRDLEELLDAGALGLKAFLVPSGLDDFPPVGEPELRPAMRLLAKRVAPLLVHAELPGPIEIAAAALHGADPRAYATWLASRPPEAETEAVRLLVRLCRETGCRTHVVHVSAADALALVAAARREGLPFTAETCPHYLDLAAEEVPDGATAFKCAPPIHGRENRRRLWEGLRDGTLTMVASDHSPCPPPMKRPESGDFLAAWGGIASLELGFALVWSGARGRGFAPERVVGWMAEGPAGLAGLEGRKGRLAHGADADLAAFDLETPFVVVPEELRQRHKSTPYVGRTLRGRARHVFVRGRAVVRDGEPTADRPGEWIPAPRSPAARAGGRGSRGARARGGAKP